MFCEAKRHYDLLIDEGNDPILDCDKLKDYMNQWDGDLFIDELKLNSNKTVLEIGVGTGRIALKLNGIFKKFVGIDISEKTVERAKTHLNKYENIDIIHGDFLDYEYKETFDVIYSSLTFLHIKDKEQAISKVKRLLNNNGQFLLSISKNQDKILDYGSRKIELYPDCLRTTLSLMESNNMIVEKILETDKAYIVVSVNKTY